jgi:hypothetical protein
MSVTMFLDLPGATTEQYDRLNEEMGTTRPEDEPEGLVSHVCATTGDGLLIFDVWRSQEELNDFLNKLGPAAAKLGLPEAAPRFAQLHYQVFPR